MKNNFLFLLLGLLLGCEILCAENIPVVPYPNEVHIKPGKFLVAGAPVICDNRLDNPSKQLIEEFARHLTAISGRENSWIISDGEKTLPQSGMCFVEDSSIPEEGYRLVVSKHKTEVSASTFAGFFYALQTIRQLLPVAIYGQQLSLDENWTLPCLEIEDAPRFAYRGMHLDVSRHFFSVEEVKRYLDILAIHKLNTFHWHLTDDQGWRIEIKRYPELTTIGSVRKATVVRKEWNRYDNTPYGGFYTQEQIREVVKYAADRAITIIPEIDLPGHMLAALTAYPELGCTGGPYEVWGRWGVSEEVLCPGKEQTFEFLENVLSEVLELFPSTYIHIGGDECPKTRWTTCPRCQERIRQLGLHRDGKHTAEHYLQSYVTKRIEKFLNDRGRRIIGWDEILEGEVAPDATVMSWRGSEGGIAAAKAGHDVLMTPTTHFYFDYYQSLDKESEPFGIGGYLPIEQVYSYNPAFPTDLSPEEQKHIIGVQANLWTEYIAENDHLEYMLLPRLAALSEVQWCNAGVRNWDRFIRNFPMAESYSTLGYRFARHLFAVSGAAAVNTRKGTIEMTLTTQGDAPIYYTLDGTEPTAHSCRYKHPVAISQSATIRATALRDTMRIPLFQRTFVFSKSTCRPVVLNSTPTLKYTYGGATAFIDGRFGGSGYTNGSYVGFLKQPLDLTIDLRGAGFYSSVRVETLADKGEWVFPPTEVEIYTSSDGEHFDECARYQSVAESESDPDGAKTIRIDFPATNARYLRVVARPATVPAWHGAAGETAHLFVSEIFVD